MNILNKLAFHFLPLYVYVFLLKNYFYLSRKIKHRKIKFNVEKHTSLIMACDELFSLWFYNPARMGRYIKAGGIKELLDNMLFKYQVTEDMLLPDGICIEVGGNIGEFSVAISPFCEQLYVFEPDPLAFRCLSRNIAKFPNIKVCNSAISDASGLGQFFISSSGADSSFIEPKVVESTIDVNTVTLNDFVISNSIDIINLLKIEAEGFEPEILYGASDILSRCKYVVLDCGPERNGFDTVEECSEFLIQKGFNVNIEGYRLKAVKM